MTALNRADNNGPIYWGTSPYPNLSHYVAQTTLGAITLPKSGIYLHRIQLQGHATLIGSLNYAYTGQRFARFPIAAAASWDYEASFLVDGQTIPSAVLTQTGGASTYFGFLFGRTPSPTAPPIDAYLCTPTTLQAMTNVGVGVPTALTNALTWDVGPAIPRAFMGFMASSNFAPTCFYLPATSGYQWGALLYESTQVDPPDFVSCPTLEPTNSITPLYGSTGTGNATGWFYYTPKK